MPMDWNKTVVIFAQVIVVVVLGILVAVGKDTYILDALLALCSSLAGIGVVHTVGNANKTPTNSDKNNPDTGAK